MRRPSLGAIFLTLLLDILGFGLVIPFLAKEARDTFHTTEFVATLLGSVYSLMQFLFVPVWGRLSDRVGRRPVLIWSVLGTSISMAGLGLGLAYGQSVAWLFAARAFGGIATANIGTASAYIADITKPEERARGMGLIGAAFGMGFILGPGLGGVLTPYEINGHRGAVPCFLAAALSLVNLAWVALGLVESLPPERRKKGASRRLAPLDPAAMQRAFRLPGVLVAVTVNFLLLLAFTILDQTFAFFCFAGFGIDERGTGLVLAFIGVLAAVVQGGVLRPLSRRFPDTALLRVGVFLQMVAFATLAMSPAWGRWALFAGGGLLAVGNGLSQPSIAAYVSKAAPAEDQGNTLGTSQSFAALARTFGPALGGWLYGSFGERVPYAVSAAGMLVALALSTALRARALAPPSQKTSTQTS